jgi:hypothetical protein
MESGDEPEGVGRCAPNNGNYVSTVGLTRKAWADDVLAVRPCEALNVAAAAECQIVRSMSWVSWVLETAPIWVASTLPFLKIIRVGMPRTL